MEFKMRASKLGRWLLGGALVASAIAIGAAGQLNSDGISHDAIAFEWGVIAPETAAPPAQDAPALAGGPTLSDQPNDPELRRESAFEWG